MAERLKLSLPLIVEGRYDKSTLSGFIDGVVITTGGFGIFNNKDKQRLLRRICSDGVIVLTDSDGGGRQIRSFLSGILLKEKIYNVYIPEIEGKEKRKAKPSKSGKLGVEGMSREVLCRILAPFLKSEPPKKNASITKTDLYLDGLTGGQNSSLLRARLCELCDLPADMSPGALLEVLNMLYSRDEYKTVVGKIKNNC